MAEPEFIAADTDPASRRSDPARNLAVVVYILQALSFFVGGITGLVGVIINYVKLDDIRNTWVEQHFRWQIRTFWIGLLWTVIGIVTTPIIIGWFILLGISIWIIFSADQYCLKNSLYLCAEGSTIRTPRSREYRCGCQRTEENWLPI